MTTKHSPLNVLKKQADKCAAMIKAFERGEQIPAEFRERIEASRHRESFKFGIIMDDQTIIIDAPWATIRATGEVGLAEYILKQMRGSRDAVH